MDPIKVIAVELAALATGMIALGAVLVGSAILAAMTPGGWLIVGLAALAASLSLLAAVRLHHRPGDSRQRRIFHGLRDESGSSDGYKVRVIAGH